MSDLKNKIDEAAELMSEFGLSEVCLEGDDWKVKFSKLSKTVGPATSVVTSGMDSDSAGDEAPLPIESTPTRPKGNPVDSPMTGIYYSSPSPGSPPFVSVGDSVSSGQVIGLVEAMKTFNEITSPVSGTVQAILIENGQLVNPGEPILYIG